MNRNDETTGAATVWVQSLKTRSTSRPESQRRPEFRARRPAALAGSPSSDGGISGSLAERPVVGVVAIPSTVAAGPGPSTGTLRPLERTPRRRPRGPPPWLRGSAWGGALPASRVHPHPDELGFAALEGPRGRPHHPGPEGVRHRPHPVDEP